AALAPAPYAEVLGVQVLETYVDGIGGIGWFDRVVNTLGEVAEGQPLPFTAVHPGRQGPCRPHARRGLAVIGPLVQDRRDRSAGIADRCEPVAERRSQRGRLRAEPRCMRL